MKRTSASSHFYRLFFVLFCGVVKKANSYSFYRWVEVGKFHFVEMAGVCCSSFSIRSADQINFKEAIMSSARSTVWILIILTVLLFIGGCPANWDLSKPNTLVVGDPNCSIIDRETTIWGAQAGGEQFVGCAVDGTYRAPQTFGSACAAELSWVLADGTRGAGDGPIHKQDGDKPFHIVNAKIVKMVCKGTEEDTNDSCHYEIKQISCAKPGDVVTVIPAGAGVNRNPVKCGDPQASIWKPPTAPARNKDCSVTVAWSGTETCTGIVTAEYEAGPKTAETIRTKPMLMTFVRVKELLFECKGSTGGDKCTYSILSTECK